MGFPTPETSRKLFDEMDFRRAVQAYLWGYPAVSFESIRLTFQQDLGMDLNDLGIADNFVDPKWRYRMMQRQIRSVTCGIAVLAMLALSGAACSSDPDAEASQGCAELATLKDSLTALTQVEPVQDGLDALQSSVATVKTDLQSAATAVSEALEPSVDQVQSSFDQLENALQGVTANTLAASATEIGTALTAVGTALTDLESDLTEECP